MLSRVPVNITRAKSPSRDTSGASASAEPEIALARVKSCSIVLTKVPSQEIYSNTEASILTNEQNVPLRRSTRTKSKNKKVLDESIWTL